MTDRSTVTSSTVTGSAAGVIIRRTLPAPTDVTVYELTEAGRALQPAVGHLAAGDTDPSDGLPR